MENREDLERVAGAVSDGTPVDWQDEMSARPDLADALLGLLRIEKLREAHTPAPNTFPLPTTVTAGTDAQVVNPGSGYEEPGIPFTWGRLRVVERLGRGGGGTVFRAHDPSLHTDIALKLLRTDRSRHPVTDLLAEARRLARVRHPNVLVVHGADEHEGRVGIWTELVRGQSLERYLQQAGPCGAREATLIGLDLCRALAAVHGAGLVHRDVKTSNVMREEGGRIVLMDFGAMGEATPGDAKRAAAGPGTPITMAPEQLRGEPAGPAADLYGLGVLLYRLVTGRYPVEADSLSDLAWKHERGERTPLRDRRPDLPYDFVEVVERAMALDPSKRFPSAGEMERALAATLGTVRPVEHPPPPGRRTARWLAGAAAAALVIVAGVLLWPRPHRPDSGAEPKGMIAPPVASGLPQLAQPVPAPLAVSASLYRRAGARDELLSSQGGNVAPGDRLSMVLLGNDRMHVYILNQDANGDVFVLFPIPGLTPSNPLESGIRYRLPGQIGDSLVFWSVTSSGGRESVVGIASREPLEELESVTKRLPRAARGRPVQYGAVDLDVLKGLRGIGRLDTEGTVRQDAFDQLNQAMDALKKRARNQGDVLVWTATLENPAP